MTLALPSDDGSGADGSDGAGAFPQRRFVATRISAQRSRMSSTLVASMGRSKRLHRSALNLRWNGHLLTVAHESMGGLPNGILVDPPIPLDQVGITPACRCRSTPRRSAYGASMLVLLSGHGAGRRHGGRARPQPLRANRARRAGDAARAGQAPRVGLGPLLVGIVDKPVSVGSLGRAAARSLASVVDALEKGSTERAVAAALPLVGLGPGATPSGDDLLVGLAAGLATTDHPMAQPWAAAVAGHAAGRRIGGESYLSTRGRLEFSERVHSTAWRVDRPGARPPRAVSAALPGARPRVWT